MIETITSKYLPPYWLRLLTFGALVAGCIYVFTNALINDHSEMRGQRLIIIGVLSILFIVFFKILFLRTVPKQVVVSIHQILIYELTLPKVTRVVIYYPDIKSTRTYRQQADTSIRSGSVITRAQTLEVELYNGQIYEISENDFENYSELKQAIYDHLFRYK